MRHLVSTVLFALLVSIVTAFPARAQDNSFLVKGGIVAVESITDNTSTEWYITQKVVSGGVTRFVRSRCASSGAQSACSALVSTVQPWPNDYAPALLWTGGCTPIQRAQSTGDTSVIDAWVCGGSGTGVCRVSTGWLATGSSTEANIGSLGNCY